MSHRIRIVLVDDQALVRAGLAALLRELPGVQLLADYADAETLLANLSNQQPELIVSDVRMPGMNGIALTQHLRAQRSAIPVLLLTTFEDPQLFLQARKAGAQGFLLKDTQPETLLEAILSLHRGGTLFEPKSTSQLHSSVLNSVQEAPKSASELGLSAREVEILKLMAGGYANKEIARALNLAEGTIKNYVSEILTKLDCDDRTRAVLKAIGQKVI